MKINKIICDLCGKEIDIEKDRAISMFETIKVLKKFDILAFNKHKDPKEGLTKTSYDICLDCSLLVEECIEKIKHDKNINTKK